MNTGSISDRNAAARAPKHLRRLALLLAAGMACPFGAPLAQTVSQATPRAVTQDPPRDTKFPARLEVLRIPSGGVEINGVAMVASGAGPHPVFVLFHGLPGNEKNLDLAQAVRRAGWTVVTLNYRGSWGSPGEFRFAQNLEDAHAALAFLRDPANARRLNIDPARIAIGGHSMGGWVAAQTAATDRNLLGTVIFSAGDMGGIGVHARADLAAIGALMDDNRESLAGVSGRSMAEELAANGPQWSFATLAPKLAATRLLVLYSDDFAKADSESLIAGIKAAGGKSLRSAHVPTDHSWSDRRIALSSLVINWLNTLPKARLGPAPTRQ
jgi:acetyl esterase/lipase